MAHPLQSKREALEKSPEREPNNVYITPPTLAAFLVNWTLDNLVTPKYWTEIGARNNHWSTPLAMSGKLVMGIENDPEVERPEDFHQWVYADAFDDTLFKLSPSRGLIGNPPYHNDWRVMVRWLASVIDHFEVVAFLLPHEWTCGTSRIEQIYSKRMPEYVLNLSPRIPFTGAGNTRLNSFYIWDKRWTEGCYKGIPINWKKG